MTYDVIISDQAEQDLRNIAEYIALVLLSPENSSAQISRLESAIFGLDQFPERHKLYEKEPWKTRGLRFFPVDNYCVFYIPQKKTATVTIIRVIYSSRNIEKILSNETNYIE